MATGNYTGGGRDWENLLDETGEEREEREARERNAQHSARTIETLEALEELDDIEECLLKGTLDYTAAAGTLIAHLPLFRRALLEQRFRILHSAPCKI